MNKYFQKKSIFSIKPLNTKILKIFIPSLDCIGSTTYRRFENHKRRSRNIHRNDEETFWMFEVFQLVVNNNVYELSKGILKTDQRLEGILKKYVVLKNMYSSSTLAPEMNVGNEIVIANDCKSPNRPIFGCLQKISKLQRNISTFC